MQREWEVALEGGTVQVRRVDRRPSWPAIFGALVVLALTAWLVMGCTAAQVATAEKDIATITADVQTGLHTGSTIAVGLLTQLQANPALQAEAVAVVGAVAKKVGVSATEVTTLTADLSNPANVAKALAVAQAIQARTAPTPAPTDNPVSPTPAPTKTGYIPPRYPGEVARDTPEGERLAPALDPSGRFWIYDVGPGSHAYILSIRGRRQ